MATLAWSHGWICPLGSATELTVVFVSSVSAQIAATDADEEDEKQKQEDEQNYPPIRLNFRRNLTCKTSIFTSTAFIGPHSQVKCYYSIAINIAISILL